MKKVFYIAGPYRADTERGVVENIRNAEAVAIDVWKAGYVALCPHLNSRLMGGICDDKVFLAGAIDLMKRCDAVVLVSGCKKSKGTNTEVKIASALRIPVYSYDMFCLNERKNKRALLMKSK